MSERVRVIDDPVKNQAAFQKLMGRAGGAIYVRGPSQKSPPKPSESSPETTGQGLSPENLKLMQDYLEEDIRSQYSESLPDQTEEHKD